MKMNLSYGRMLIVLGTLCLLGSCGGGAGPDVRAPVITSALTASGNQGAPFQYHITATNNPTTYDALGAGIPSEGGSRIGVTYSTGLINGTPVTPGTYSYTISATNAYGTGSATLVVTIGPPLLTITSPKYIKATQGYPFSFQIAATNNPTSFGWGGGLMNGLTTNTTTGVISGIPAQLGRLSATQYAYGAAGTGSDSLEIVTVAAPSAAPVITSAGFGEGLINVPFTYQVEATNSPSSYSVVGVLPTGLVFDSFTGEFSGIPTVSGVYSVVVVATNVLGSATETVVLNIDSTSFTLTATSAYLEATVNGGHFIAAPVFVRGFEYGKTTAYGQTLSQTGTFGPGTFFLHAKGLTCGTLYHYRAFTTSAGGTQYSADNTFTTSACPSVAPAITSSATATATVGAPFAYASVATNGPTSFLVTGLSNGLTYDATTGLIYGTPTATGTVAARIRANNALGSGMLNIAISIGSNPSAIVPPAITSAISLKATTGSAFSYAITASNSPTSYSATGLPTGLSINTSTGIISGTPTDANLYIVKLGATNSGGASYKTLTIVTQPAIQSPPVITSAWYSNPSMNMLYFHSIEATNYPTSYGATGLAPGLSLNTTTGDITGIPTAAGVYTATLGATNAGGTGTQVFTVTVSAAHPDNPAVTSASTATGTVGVAFSYTITATNSPTRFSAGLGYTGTMPGGLSIDNATGVISGTPTTAGIYSLTIGAHKNDDTNNGYKTLTITIN